jgi:hypothetical protein
MNVRVQKLTPEQYEDFRREYPFHVKFSSVLSNTDHLTNADLRHCREFFQRINAKCVINKNSAYFASDRDAVLCKLGMWIVRL